MSFFSPTPSAKKTLLEPEFQFVGFAVKQTFSILAITTLFFNCLHIYFHTGLQTSEGKG